MCKNNSRNSCKIKACSPLQPSCGLTGKCHAFGYIFLYQRYPTIKNEETNNYNIIIFTKYFRFVNLKDRTIKIIIDYEI